MAEKIASDIQVYDGTAWKSMNGQKVYDGSNWKDFQGVYDGADWWKIKNNSLNIPFASNFKGTQGEIPTLSAGVIQESGHITFSKTAAQSYLTYNIGSMLSDAAIVTITIDIRLNELTPSVKNGRVFIPEGDIMLNSPLSIQFAWWDTGNQSPEGDNKSILYVCGIPDDPNGRNPYKAYTLGEWHTIKLVWDYSTKLVTAYKDSVSLSGRWHSASRPEYVSRPSEITFGWKSGDAASWCSVKNFKLSVE